jgi:hypothetical protein
VYCVCRGGPTNRFPCGNKCCVEDPLRVVQMAFLKQSFGQALLAIVVKFEMCKKECLLSGTE